jgi:hypothetical protein
MADREYDVESENKLSRERLSTKVPERLQLVLDALASLEGEVEEWRRNLLAKVVTSVGRVCRDLLETMDKDALPAAAWNARNLLELWVWSKYCGASRENARRFYEDALRDFQGMTESLSKMHKARGLTYEFEDQTRQGLSDMAKRELGMASLDSRYLRVSDAAKSVGLGDWYGPCHADLSKIAHPTAGLVIGIMHQSEESLREMQSTKTTLGVFFAGQCAIELTDAVLALRPTP